MARKKDIEVIGDIIQMLSLRKKQIVTISKELFPKLRGELTINYPKAKFFATKNTKGYACIRVSAARTFKKPDGVKIWGEKTATKLCAKHEILLVWRGHNQRSTGRVITDKVSTVVYLDAPSPLLAPNWTPVSQPPEGKKPHRMVLVRRSSDEILMGRCIGDKWIAYFNNPDGMQVVNGAPGLKGDPIVDWQELPITQQQYELANQ